MKLKDCTCSITCMLMKFVTVYELLLKLIGHPLIIISVAVLCGLYTVVYFNLCGALLFQDLFGIDRQHYICVKFSGRLGNLMFQYAFLYSFAKKKKLVMLFKNKDGLQNVFDLTPGNLASSGVDRNRCWCFWMKQDYWDCAHDEGIENLPEGKDLSFDGYFQSWMYWKEYEKEIRKQFYFKSSIREGALLRLRSILSSRKVNYTDTTIVGIHIRRGDYFKSHFKNYGYGVADAKYLRNAMKYYRDRFKKVLFIACSNDISWTMDVLSKYNDVQVVVGNRPEQDMAILTYTNHTIMTVGTFGWWIAFLTNGTTVYYKYPYIEGTGFSKQFKNLSEHFYPGWIPME